LETKKGVPVSVPSRDADFLEWELPAIAVLGRFGWIRQRMLEISSAAHDFSLRVLAGPSASVDESRARRMKRSITSRPVLAVSEQ